MVSAKTLVFLASTTESYAAAYCSLTVPTRSICTEVGSVLNKMLKTAKYLPSVVPSVLAHTTCNSKGEY